MPRIMEKTKLIKPLTTDDVLRQIGEFGKFQKILDGVFCIMLLPSTFQTLIMYFAALRPNWKCANNSTLCTMNGTFTSDNEFRCTIPRSEWEFTEPKEYSIVTEFDIYCDEEWIIYVTTSILFLGWAIGSMILGWVADNYGRKTILFPSLFICLVIGLVSPFVPNLAVFIVCRFVVGFFLPGTALQMFIIISELVGGKHRPKAGLILWIFLTVAFVIVGIKAYFIRQWKMLFVVCTAPYLFVLLFCRFVPESVRWLRLQNRTKEAIDIFQRIADWNGTEFDAKAFSLHMFDSPRMFKSRPQDLFLKPSLLKKSLIQGNAWLVSGMIFYGFAIGADDLGGSLYLNYILVSVVEIPGILLAIDFCERFGRKKTVLVPMFLGGLACGLITIMQPDMSNAKLLKILLSLIGKMFVTMSFDSIYTWSAELYPTELRAEGLGYCQVTSRLGAAIAPWVVKGFRVLHKSAPYFVMCSMAILSSLMLVILPETKDMDTLETEQDAEYMDERENACDHETLI